MIEVAICTHAALIEKMTYERYQPQSRQNPLVQEAQYIAQEMDYGNAHFAVQRLQQDLLQMQGYPGAQKQLIALVDNYEQKGRGSDVEAQRNYGRNGETITNVRAVDYRTVSDGYYTYRQPCSSENIAVIISDQSDYYRGGRNWQGQDPRYFQDPRYSRPDYRLQQDPRYYQQDPRYFQEPRWNQQDPRYFQDPRYYQQDPRYFENSRYYQPDPRYLAQDQWQQAYSQPRNYGGYWQTQDYRNQQRDYGYQLPQDYTYQRQQQELAYQRQQEMAWLRQQRNMQYQMSPQERWQMQQEYRARIQQQNGWMAPSHHRFSSQRDYMQQPNYMQQRGFSPEREYSQQGDYRQGDYRQQRGRHQHRHGYSYDYQPQHQRSSQYSERQDFANPELASMRLTPEATEAFARAQQLAARDGVKIDVSSAGRSYQEQAQLYRELAGKSPVARPGTSNHESGQAIDVRNYSKAKPYLLAAGFVHGDGQGQIKGDPWHFRYMG